MSAHLSPSCASSLSWDDWVDQRLVRLERRITALETNLKDSQSTIRIMVQDIGVLTAFRDTYVALLRFLMRLFGMHAESQGPAPIDLATALAGQPWGV